jgi:hypothetical protein
MKRFLTYTPLPLLLAFLCLWSAPARLADAAAAQNLRGQTAEQRDAFGRPQLAGEVWRRTELYFGSARPDGSVVTEAEFQQFVDSEITPRFPDGLTLLTGYGQFRNSAGFIVKERSMELILLYPPHQRDADRKIEAARTAYKQAFQQESVLRVDSLAVVSF